MEEIKDLKDKDQMDFDKTTSEFIEQEEFLLNGLQFKNKLIEPVSKEMYPELNRDFQLGNLDKNELNDIRQSYVFIRHLKLLEHKNQVLGGLATHFLAKANMIMITSNSKNGSLRKRMNETIHTVDQSVKNTNEIEKSQTFPFFKNKKSQEWL